MKQWYEDLFDNYAESYDKEPFTHGTIQEVDFIENEINYDKSKIILDIGCGTGRHAIELAKRAYNITGIDLSDSQLKRARIKAKQQGVDVNFKKADARKFNFHNHFDLVIMICGGAFSLMETDEMNFQILENATRSLKAKGKFIFTSLNALFPLFHSVKDFLNANSQKIKKTTFDLMTFREKSILEITDDSGKLKTLKCDERYYTPSEISWLLKSLKYKKVDIYGCTTGEFSRNKKLHTDDFGMLVIAEK